MHDTLVGNTVSIIAKSARDSDSILKSFKEAEIPINEKTRKFANDLFNKVPRNSFGSVSNVEEQARKRHRESVRILAENQKYQLLSDGEDEMESSKANSTKKVKAPAPSKTEKGKRLRQKEDAGNEDRWNEDNVKVYNRYEARDPDEDPEGELLERKRDMEEKEAFEERLREKDKERTKHLVQDHSSKLAEDEALGRRQLLNDADARKAAMPDLRERSRQEYLKKREVQKVELLKLSIADDEFLFRDDELTEQEKKRREYNKELLRLVEERQKISKEKGDRYYMPENYLDEKGKMDKKKKEEALYARYQEEDQSKFVNEQDQWESALVSICLYFFRIPGIKTIVLQ